jgi:hypothetical protein
MGRETVVLWYVATRPSHAIVRGDPSPHNRRRARLCCITSLTKPSLKGHHQCGHRALAQLPLETPGEVSSLLVVAVGIPRDVQPELRHGGPTVTAHGEPRKLGARRVARRPPAPSRAPRRGAHERQSVGARVDSALEARPRQACRTRAPARSEKRRPQPDRSRASESDRQGIWLGRAIRAAAHCQRTLLTADRRVKFMAASATTTPASAALYRTGHRACMRPPRARGSSRQWTRGDCRGWCGNTRLRFA